jgi:hypothetical protein
MAPDDLSPSQQDALRGLRAARGGCPPAEALVEYGDLDAGAQARHSIHEHVTVCGRCQLVLLNVEQAEADGAAAMPTSRSYRWLLPVAALIALAIAGPALYRFIARPPADRTGSVRGSEVTPIGPAGEISAPIEFVWQSPLQSVRYRVIVLRGTQPVWTAETAATRMSPPPGTLQPGISYRWRVEALDREGVVRMSSPETAFIVRSASSGS